MNWYTLLGIHPTVYLNVYQQSPDLAGCSRTRTDTKKPAGLVPCGLSGLHRMTLVITDGEFWWSWRELNPRPKFLHPRYYMLSQSLHSPGTCGRTRHYQTSLIRFNASTPGRASTRSLLGLTSLDPRPKSGG